MIVTTVGWQNSRCDYVKRLIETFAFMIVASIPAMVPVVRRYC